MARTDLFSRIKPYVRFAGAKVLDAGSGAKSFDFLITQDLEELCAVSIDPEEVRKLRDRVAELSLNKEVDIRQADLSTETEFKKDHFDIVFADYFFAAVEGHTPFRVGYAMRELKRLIKNRGKLIVTGWNASPDQPNLTDAKQELIMRTMLLRDCADLLIGRTTYRELPDYWVTDLAELHKFKLLQKFYNASVITLSFFESYSQSILNKASEIPNRELGKAMREEALSLLDKAIKAKQFSEGVAFGQDYALIFEAEK